MAFIPSVAAELDGGSLYCLGEKHICFCHMSRDLMSTSKVCTAMFWKRKVKNKNKTMEGLTEGGGPWFLLTQYSYVKGVAFCGIFPTFFLEHLKKQDNNAAKTRSKKTEKEKFCCRAMIVPLRLRIMSLLCVSENGALTDTCQERDSPPVRHAESQVYARNDAHMLTHARV